MNQEHEVVLYQVEGTNICVNVIFKEDIFWMTQKAMADLFGCTTDNISLHLKNIYKEEELDENETTEFFSVVQNEGQRNVKRKVISHDTAMQKAEKEYEVFRVKQDREYISEFDREVEKYLKG